MMHDLILGTAGHIDHGKTSLIRALTGTDTDRLPEEKRRGITIELGFAELQLDGYRLGIVDVPGHERFVRQMLAGATGMDVALLVVAADDSVKPQTLEHLEVLKYMDLPSGVIALTKCDLADPAWVELVEAEVREVVHGTFLERAPILRTSAATGQGLDALRAALTEASAHAVARLPTTSQGAPFRMAIDRAFSIPGHGAVVTGSVASGAVAVGDTLVLEPGSREVRVRGLQNHDRPAESVRRGQRAAINLAGVRHDEIVRGHELASRGHLVASRTLTVQMSVSSSYPRPLKHRTRVRLHVGTAEILARVHLLEAPLLAPGKTAFAQLVLQLPAATVWNQPFVIRAESPVATMGGGRILVPSAERIRKFDDQQHDALVALRDQDTVVRAAAALRFATSTAWEPAELVRTAGVVDVEPVTDSLRRQGILIELVASPQRTLRLHRQVYQRWCDRITRHLVRMYDENRLRLWFDITALASTFPNLRDPLFLPAVLQRMHADGLVHLRGQRVALPSHQPQLSKADAALLNQMIAEISAGGLQPPTVVELQKAHAQHERRIPALLELAAAEGTLVPISPAMYLHQDALSQLCANLRTAMSDGRGRTVSEIRELLGITRKHAVPICEFLDRLGFTRRAGDLRLLGPASALETVLPDGGQQPSGQPLSADAGPAKSVGFPNELFPN